MSKQNCWETKNCGRQTGGAKVAELGVCPASQETKLNGVNEGANAGRVCWALAGTFCGGLVQGSFAEKIGNCMNCDHYKLVHDEEGSDCKKTSEILEMLKG
ncbi:MAG: hypothetical protein UT66_C0033G0011 [candidate division CPR2 bacterium GW2011_GWC1_39_9]|uniref:Uncharacterized protein n=1 Tax=candidate division CPR2 bacterium GW2011_GWC2_39_10 TaxID=1618345 RepID=A0A0G0PWW8_UNCC2|nr:MAG: hypothetical protein UT18_C0015G0020 [candidate division CPR2 bacterium GW2011_GWC2_39_10]KKR33861.1 MAG: hypothetical protein UT66_C0033G0011 [candidate division CPR2 bacterium GW2011_GWC1_39_9]